jgi:isopenicillin-N N-acyltransferase like protein
MKSLLPTFVATLLLAAPILGAAESPGLAGATRFDSDRAGLSKNGRLHILELGGSARERGLRHGRALRSEIAGVFTLWQADIARNTKRDAAVVITEFLAATNFIPAIEKWTPDLLEEVRGIAEGAGQSFDTVFAFQLLDELWVYLDQKNAHHCSSLGVPARGTRPALVAQNMDLGSFRDGYQVVLHLAESASGPEQFVFTCAGLIATNGLNRHGIALACNTLMQLQASASGLPVAFVVRGVLAQRQGAAAADFLRRVPHASGQNYVLGTGRDVADFEASAGKVVPLPPAANGTVVHTNHPLVNDDLKPWHRTKIDQQTPQQKASNNSATRLLAVEQRIGQAKADIDTDVIKATLQSKDSAKFPVCVPVKPNGGSTFGGVIMILSKMCAMEVTAGPPDVNPFVRFTFSHASE